MDGKTGQPETRGESYLQIEEGKSFRLKFRCVRPAKAHPDFHFHIEIDGRRIRGGTWMSHRAEKSVDSMYIMEDGVTKLADLTFASLPKTDEEGLATVRGTAINKLCKIDVSIQQGKYTSSVSAGNHIRRTAEGTVGKVHEKQLKLGSTIQATNSRPPVDSKHYSFTPAKQGADVCRFMWNYHSRAQLSLMGIVEDDPPNAAQVNPAPPPATSALAAFAAQLNQSVKREASAQCVTGTNGAKRIKSEQLGTGAQNQPISFAEGEATRQSVGQARVKAEVIDLTGD